MIGKDEVIDDDLYLAGDEIIVERTVNGDLMAAGTIVVINGTVTGDLWAAAREVTINGQVDDDLFTAAAAITLGPAAQIADDVFSAAASVETQSGSSIRGELMVGAFQGLLAGQVLEDLHAGTNRLRLERLRQAGLTEEQLARLHAPIGLNLGGRSTAEIAVSIIAEIIQVRSQGDNLS